MIRKLAHILRRIAILLVAVGVVTLGTYAFSMSSFGLSLSEDHGERPAAMTFSADTSSMTNSIVLVDAVSSSDTSAAVAQAANNSATASDTTAATVRQGPPNDLGGHDGGGSLIHILSTTVPNVGILFTISAVVAVIQTVLKRRKRSQKLKVVPA